MESGRPEPVAAVQPDSQMAVQLRYVVTRNGPVPWPHAAVRRGKNLASGVNTTAAAEACPSSFDLPSSPAAVQPPHPR